MILVITGPSGVGKTSLKEALVQEGWSSCLTCTTRAPREGEVHGVDYYFLKAEDFGAAKRQGAFIETSQHYGHQYGLRRQDLMNQQGNVVVLLNWEGALEVEKVLPEAFVVFVCGPSVDVIKERLRLRCGDDSRAQYYEKDMQYAKYFQHQLVNEDFDQAYAVLKQMLQNRR